jgi:hypothetical protein
MARETFMSEQKHTPGPWRIGTPGPNGCHTVGTERGLMTAMVAHSINEPDQAEAAKADASLIAAAPELLEALLALECDVNTMAYCYDKRPENFWRSMEVAKRNAQRAREVIAKAGGQS